MPDDTILIIDDEQELVDGLRSVLTAEMPQLKIVVSTRPRKVLELIEKKIASLVLTDVRMPGMDGLELLSRIKEIDPSVTVVIMTAFGSIETAVDAVKRGAYEYLCKPFDYETLFRTIRKGLERSQLIRENISLKRRMSDRTAFGDFVGQSEVMHQFYNNIQAVARTNYTVLVRGESGTGKELTAKSIHFESSRRNGPLVMINCPAIPEHLLESELFGHKKGAFTGADSDRVGLFVEANGGTICLDEIGDIPISVQTKLLRVLQDNVIRPLGTAKSVKTDVRVVAVTNQDLEKKISDGLFRSDLFYRLNVVTINTPKLSDILEDIPLLINHFLQIAAFEQKQQPKNISPEAVGILAGKHWPGNVRELQNAVRRAVMFCPGNEILPEHLVTPGDSLPVERINNKAFRWRDRGIVPYKSAKESVMQEFSSAYLEMLLTKTRGNVTRAAEISQLSRAAFQKIMRRYDVKSDSYRYQQDAV